MPLQDLDLGRGSDEGRDFQDGYTRHINCYVEPRGNAGKSAAPIYGIDGLTNFTQLPDPSSAESIGAYTTEEDVPFTLITEDGVELALEGLTAVSGIVGDGVQDMLTVGLYLYSVAGGSLYRTDSGGFTNWLGSFPKDEPATLAANRALPTDVAVVSGGKLYVSTNGATPSQVTTNIIGAPNSVAHLDGYFILTYPDGRWQISNIDSGTTWDSGDFSTAVYATDTTLRPLVRGSDLCLIGSKSIEFWQNVGTTFPFQRVTAIDVGCSSGQSCVVIDNALLFIDDNYEVRMLEGYEPATISTPWVSRIIRESARPSAIVGSFYRRDMHTFYTISGDDFTLVYDLLTGTWHEEESDGLSRRKVSVYESLAGNIIAGNYASGVLYTVDRASNEDGDGERIFFRIDTPIIHAWPARLKFNCLYVDHIAGTGRTNTLADDEDPKLQLWISENSGKNFWHWEDFEMGDINDPLINIETRGLGTPGPDGYVFSLRCPCNVQRGIIAAKIDVELAEPRRVD